MGPLMGFWIENFIAGISLSSLVNFMAAIAGMIAAAAAFRGVTIWRDEMVGRRRAELAEETLARLYQARDLVTWIRHPFAMVGEGQTREQFPEETTEQRRALDSYFAPIERFNKHKDFWASFDASHYRFRAVFGISAATPFVTVQEKRNSVLVTAQSLIRHNYANRHLSNRDVSEHTMELITKWEAVIWWGDPVSDEIATAIEKAVADMESTCRPAIDGFYRRKRTWVSPLPGKQN